MVDPSVWSLVRNKSDDMWEDSNPDAYAGISNRFQAINDYAPPGGRWLNIKSEKFVGNTMNTREDEDYHPDAVPSHTLLDEGFPLEFETKKRRRRKTTKPKEKKKIVAKRKSKYRGVSWSKPSQKWTAQVSHGGSKYYAGLYSSDLDAAHAVNRECDRLMITRRNPGIGDPPVNLKKKQVRKKAARVSRYLGVSWCKNANKWQARVWHKGKYHWAGYYDTDKEAVDAMYNTCKILNIPRVKQDLIRMPELRILQSKKWLVSTDSHNFTLNEKGEFDRRDDGILRGRLSNFSEPKGTLHAKFTWGAMTGTIYFVRLEREGFDGIYESTCGKYGRWIGTPFQNKKSKEQFYRLPDRLPETPMTHYFGKNSKKRYLNISIPPNFSKVLNPPPPTEYEKTSSSSAQPFTTKGKNSKKRYLNISIPPNFSKVLNPPPPTEYEKTSSSSAQPFTTKAHNSKKRFLNIAPTGGMGLGTYTGNGLNIPLTGNGLNMNYTTRDGFSIPLTGNGLNMTSMETRGLNTGNGLTIPLTGNGLTMPINYPTQEFSKDFEKPAKRRKVTHRSQGQMPRRLDDFSIPPPHAPRSPSLTPEPTVNLGDVHLPLIGGEAEVKKEEEWDSLVIPDLPPPSDIPQNSNKSNTLTRMERQQVRAKKLEPIFTTIGREGKAVNLFCNHCKEKFTAKPTFRAKYGHYLVNHRCFGMDHRQQYVVGMKRRSCELNCSSGGCISLDL